MLKRFYRVWTCFWRFVRKIISHADLNQMVELNLRIQCYWFWSGERWTGPIIFAMFFATHGPTRSSRWKSHWPGRLLWAWAQAKMAWMSLPKCNMFFWIEIDRLHPLIRWLQNVWNPHSNQSLSMPPLQDFDAGEGHSNEASTQQVGGTTTTCPNPKLSKWFKINARIHNHSNHYIYIYTCVHIYII